jgi:putative nucleotidyltransferase with HDIG domain
MRAGTVALAGWSVCLAWFAVADHARLAEPLTVVLALCALAASVASARWDGPLMISGSFMASLMAVAYVGPAAAFFVTAVAELGGWALTRYRLPALLINLFVTGAPNLIAAGVFVAMAPGNERSVSFYFALALVACLALTLNVASVTVLSAWLHGDSIGRRIRAHTQLIPAFAITVALTVATAGVHATVGLAGAAFVLLNIVAFTYMARLVVTARERTRAYAALSWGVLSGLLRTLDRRDGRAARHSAAVAAFARDIAVESGLGPSTAELAHTTGLLHDIGRFALSDRVMERDVPLRESDWEGIREHPVLGASMLADLGVYGPIAEIVRAHHERVDGRGYPDGLIGDQIPVIARIIAVAEVYDTLTAVDTYRSPMSSFEALTELRRVSGTQLDGHYVEALGRVLAGRSFEYRHADAADFDRELDMERRVSEAAGS